MSQENPHEQPTLTPRQQYVKQRHKGCIQLYFGSEEEKRALQETARSHGYRNFSEWCRTMIHQGRNGSSFSTEYVSALKQDCERYTQWIEQKDQQIEVLRRDLRLAEQQRDDLRVVLASIAHRSPEAAKALHELSLRRE